MGETKYVHFNVLITMLCPKAPPAGPLSPPFQRPFLPMFHALDSLLVLVSGAQGGHFLTNCRPGLQNMGM